MRSLLGPRRRFACWLLAAALLMKMLVPTGYMATASGGSITISLCSGYGPQRVTVPLASMAHGDAPMIAAMAGMKHHDGESDGGKGKQPCPFATLTTSPLAPDLGSSDHVVALLDVVSPAIRPLATAPGRGMAAPPPRSHAPPTLRA